MDNFDLIKKFSENCSAHPDDTAIIDAGTETSLSYHELAAASGKVYRYLTGHGIGREDVVMILLPRGAKPFISIVGVWKAGAAYVMLETDYPTEKLEFIKNDMNCKLVIDENVYDEMMQGDVLQGYKLADPHDLSYIIYTSGTTGNPKGVMHEYGTIGMDIATWQYAGRPLFGQTDNFIQLTPLNFTATIILFHAVIYAGAALTTVPIETVKNINRLLAVMNKNGITAGFFTPSLFRLLPKLPDSMNQAVEKLKAKYPERKFYSIDTKGITTISYLIVREIGDLVKAGKTAEEIVAWSKTEIDHFAMYFFADDLKFFRRSGRVSGLAATMGGLIGLRPIIYMSSEGKMVSNGTEKGRVKAMERLLKYVEDLGDDIKNHRIVVGHTDALDLAKQLGEMLKTKFGDDLNLEYVCTNPTAGSHCGPNGVGVCFHAIHR